jgi:release factor glutamine methyltransferase
MKIREMIAEGTRMLKATGIECAESDARLLAQYVLKTDYTGLMLKLMDEVDEADRIAFNTCIFKRGTHYPCQYIIGSQEFMGYEFDVAQYVLIPRPETEILVETALDIAGKMGDGNDQSAGLRVLDMGCGSGCIGISFKLCRQKKGYTNDTVTLADISDKALALTKKNSKKLDAEVDIVKTDLFENIDGKYDMILSNPPYIRSGDVKTIMKDVRLYEPKLALDGHEDGLYFYKRIIKDAREYLNENGVIIFEIGYDQAEDIRSLLVESGYTDIEVIKDYAGFDRIVSATLLGGFKDV